jgi:hypothetical protein
MSLRPDRKLRNLNVWQRGIEHYRSGQRERGAAGSAPAQGWAKALFRRLLGRRAAGASSSAKGMTTAPLGAIAQNSAADGPAQLTASRTGDQRPEIREGMLSRRAVLSAQAASPSRMTHVGTIDVAGCRDLRFWRRGREFVAAAHGGFDAGGGAEYLAQRRVATVSRSQASQAALSLRLLLRAVASRSAKDDVAPLPVGSVAPAGLSRKSVQNKPPRPVAIAAGARRGKSFRDPKFRQQGLGLLEKALRAQQKHGLQHKALEMYRPATPWTPKATGKSPGQP